MKNLYIYIYIYCMCVCSAIRNYPSVMQFNVLAVIILSYNLYKLIGGNDTSGTSITVLNCVVVICLREIMSFFRPFL